MTRSVTYSRDLVDRITMIVLNAMIETGPSTTPRDTAVSILKSLADEDFAVLPIETIEDVYKQIDELETEMRTRPTSVVHDCCMQAKDRRRLLVEAASAIDGLAGQQAMPDDFYVDTLNSINDHLASTTGAH